MLFSKKFSLDVDVFVSRKKRHVHIAFKIPISEYKSFDELIDFISTLSTLFFEWTKRKIFLFDYKMIYPRFDEMEVWLCLFWKEKKIMENNVLEKLCHKIVDVIHETFTRKYYFIKISQSKKGHI